ncbi:MAG: NERD domain-containing protein [Bacillus sp. (in: firmicutes)]
MAQLIKLQDYVSRYEQDIYRYPAQFMKLKKQHWEKQHTAFLEGTQEQGGYETVEEDWFMEKPGLFLKVKNIFHKKEWHKEENRSRLMEKSVKDVNELKEAFLNQLFHFQMSWATSTTREKSYADQQFFENEKLRFFLQRFPDTMFVMFQPIFQVKKAPVEAETILLTPTETWCVTVLDGEDGVVHTGTYRRFWTRRQYGKADATIVSPLIGLKRTELIIKQIYIKYGVKMPIKKAVISKEGYFDLPSEPNDVALLDRHTYKVWHETMRNSPSLLKGQQLKGADVLLDHCLTHSVQRTVCYE